MNSLFSRLHDFFSGGRPATPEERRTTTRYRMQIDVTISANGHSWRAMTSDMSQHGMGFYCSAPFEIGDQVVLSYALGDGSPPKKVPAVIRGRNSNRYSAEFTA